MKGAADRVFSLRVEGIPYCSKPPPHYNRALGKDVESA